MNREITCFRLCRRILLALALISALSSTTWIQAQPLYQFTVAKARVYLQTNASPPMLDYDLPFIFEARASASTLLSPSAATLQPPGRPPLPMLPIPDGFGLDTNFDTQVQMDTAFPAGSYSCDIVDALGTATLSIPLTGDQYPDPPMLLNYAEAQGISATEDFHVTFPAHAGSTLLDTAELRIVEPTSGGPQVVYTNTIFVTNTLPVAQAVTNIVIPANTLTTGKTYYGVLQLLRVADFVSDWILSASTANFISVNQFTLRTPTEPLLRISPSATNGLLSIRFNATPGRTYHLLGSSDLSSWPELQSLTATQGYETFQVPALAARQFFRVAYP
jgi:hypothetical protein